MTIRVLEGDCRDLLPTLPAQSVHCIVSSPPYFGLRDYDVDGQIGLEQSPEEFVEQMVLVFREARRVLRDDGTLWLNLGDSYASRPNGSIGKESRLQGAYTGHTEFRRAHALRKPGLPEGLKHKDLIGIPWRVAFALQRDGWYLRQTMPWVKRNPMPESAKDRPTTASETVFLLTKSASYYYDYEAVRRRASPSTNARLAQDVEQQVGSARANGGKAHRPMKAVRKKTAAPGSGIKNNTSYESALALKVEMRALRNADLFFDSLDTPFGAISLPSGEIIAFDTVTEGYSEAHFATFPPKLILPMIIAGCPVGGTVLDPFGGAGTTGMVADRLRRSAIMIELNPTYADIARGRLSKDAGIFAEIA